MERAKAGTNDKGRRVIERIEKTLQETVLGVLKQEFCSSPDQWWFEGVPKSVRKKVDERINESDGKAGKREQNFDLIHYRDIIIGNWGLFDATLAHGTGNKDKRTNWITEVGQMRNIVMHPSRREYLSAEQLSKIQEYDEWLQNSVAGDTDTADRGSPSV